jgi:cytoskeleton protein RodZ
MASMTTMLGLEQIRRRKGVSLQDISESTKISTFFLRAIESEEFEKLPGGIYNTNYIRQYASAIDFAEDKLLALYKDFQEAARAREELKSQPVQQRKSRGWLDWLLAPSPRNS